MNEISHHQAQQYIQAAADGILSEAQQELLAAHLAGCPECRQYQAEIDQLGAALRQALTARLAWHNAQAVALPQARPSHHFFAQIRSSIRMKNMQRASYAFLSLIVIGVLVVGGLVFARKTLPTPTPAAPTTGPVPTLQPTPTDPPIKPVVADEKIVLTFAAEPAVKSVYQPLMDAFHQEHPEISLQFVELDPTLQFDSASLAALADTTLLSGRFALISGAGYFRDLTPLMEMDPNFQPHDIWPDALSGCQDGEDRSLGIPLSLSVLGILYDPQALDADGLPHPQPGWTWEDFRHTVTALSIGATPSRQYPFVDQSVYKGDQFIAADYLIAPILDARLRNSNGAIDPAALAQSIQWYLDLVGEQRIFPVTEYGKSPAHDQLYQDGYPALWVGATNSWIESGSALQEYNLAPFPVDSQAPGDGSSIITARCGVVSAGSQHPREAWLWLNFLSHQWIHGDERLVYINEAIPARPSVANSNPVWESIPANAQEAIRFGLEHGWYGSPYPDALWAVTRAILTSTGDGSDLVAALDQAKVELASLPAPQGPQTPIVVATPRAPDSEVSTVRFFTNEVFESRQKMVHLADEFSRLHPSIRVELPSVTNPVDFPSSTDDGFTFSAEHYDCFESALPELSIKDLSLLYDLNTLLDQDSTIRPDLYPGQIDAYTLDGKIYGLPASLQPNLMFYNKDLLARLGLPAPTPDWTYDDFIQLANAAATTLDGQAVYGFAPYAHRDLGLLLAGQEVTWLDVGGVYPATRFSDPPVLDAYRRILALVQSGVLLPTTGMDGSATIQEALYAGRLALWTAEANVWGGWYMNRPDPIGYEIGAVPLPETPVLNTANNPGMTGLFLSKKSQHPQACWTWMTYLSAQPGVFPGIPARRSVANSPAWETVIGQEKAAAYRAAVGQSAGTLKPSSWENHILSSMFYFSSGALADMIQGIDPGIALATAQRKAEFVLQCLDNAQLSNLAGPDRETAINACMQSVASVR